MTNQFIKEPKMETILYDVEGVHIIAEIDYEKGTVSFVDKDGEPYEYVFSGRTRKYLGGWIKIFNALEAVTRDVDERLLQNELQKERHLHKKVLEWSEINRYEVRETQ